MNDNKSYNSDARDDQEADNVIEQRLKVLIVGEPGAGKRDVAKGTDVCIPFKSLGVSIGKKIKLNKKINYKLTLIFWTLTKGRPKYTTYFRGSNAAIIVGNLRSRFVIKKMNYWANTIFEHVGNIPLFFIGKSVKGRNNKRIRNLEELAKNYHGTYYVFSPLEENALNRIFRSIAKVLAKKNYKLFQEEQLIIS